MSLYHEAAAVLSTPASTGGSFKSRIFGNSDLKSPPAQIYALAMETCKWSAVLKEVIENADILRHERKVGIIFVFLIKPKSDITHTFLLISPDTKPPFIYKGCVHQLTRSQ
jgi:hypothetical protein